MKICKCGHRHCCHGVQKVKEMYVTNDYGKKYKFARIYCAKCGFWLSDTPPKLEQENAYL